MSHLVLTVFAAIASGSSGYAELLDRLPKPGDYALIVMVLTGLAVGWFGGRNRPSD